MTMAAARLDRRRLEHFSLWNLGRVVSSAGKLNASFVRSISVSPVHAALISDVRFVVVVVAFSSPRKPRVHVSLHRVTMCFITIYTRDKNTSVWQGAHDDITV